MTRLEILRDAREIALTQGAVHYGMRFWEDKLTGEECSFALGDPGDCRVCVAGAVMLAELRAGLTPNRHATYGPITVRLTERVGRDWIERLQDNTPLLVDMIEILIADEEARQQEFHVEPEAVVA